MSIKNKGFTLIELMIALSIIGILAAAILPSYREYVLEWHRSRMQADLYSIIELQERYYINNFTYADDMTKLGFDVAAGTGYTYIYQGSEAYTVTVQPCIGVIYPDAPPIARCFIFAAKALGEQAQDGDLLIDNRGREELNFSGSVLRDWNGNDL